MIFLITFFGDTNPKIIAHIKVKKREKILKNKVISINYNK